LRSRPGAKGAATTQRTHQTADSQPAAGLVDAPLLPDASNVLKAAGLLSYDTSSSPPEAAAFYQEQIPILGWTLIGEPTISGTTVVLTYTQGDQKMTVIITAGAGVTTVNILLESFQE